MAIKGGESGTISSISNGMAYVKVKAESEPRALPYKIPKRDIGNISVGDDVFIANIDGSSRIIAVYEKE